MDAQNISAVETTLASRKLGEADASDLLANAQTLIVAKGKKVRRWQLTATVDDEAKTAMLGPTGNLRAPTLRVGTTLLVGFNEEVYSEVLRSGSS